MNLEETLAIIAALKSSGVTRFKSNDLEIDFSPSADEFKVKKLAPLPEPTAPDAKEVEAKEKLKNLINTVKMTPEELANTIFPDGAM